MPLRPVAIVAATLLVAGVALGLVLPLVALASGYHLVRVTGASMAPSINRGAMLAVRPLAGQVSIHDGDVVSFRTAGSEAIQQVVTHRVVAVGRTGLVTAGDANAAADPLPVDPSRVIGVAAPRWLSLSGAMGAAVSPAGIAATYLPALGVLALACRDRAGLGASRRAKSLTKTATSSPQVIR